LGVVEKTTSEAQYIGAASRTSGSQSAGATFTLAAGNTKLYQTPEAWLMANAHRNACWPADKTGRGVQLDWPRKLGA